MRKKRTEKQRLKVTQKLNSDFISSGEGYGANIETIKTMLNQVEQMVLSGCGSQEILRKIKSLQSGLLNLENDIISVKIIPNLSKAISGHSKGLARRSIRELLAHLKNSLQ